MEIAFIILSIVFITTFISGVLVSFSHGEIKGYILFSLFGIILFPFVLLYIILYKLSRRKRDRLVKTIGRSETLKLYNGLGRFRDIRILFVKVK